MYFVTLYANNTIYQFKIDEFIQKLEKGYLSADCGIEGKKIYFPIVIKGDAYCLGIKSLKYEIRCNNQAVEDNRELTHGDYYVVTAEKQMYSVLITSCDRLSMTGAVYALGTDPVFIGRSPDSTVVLDINASVSRKCAAIHMDEYRRYFLEDLSGKTGVYVNGHREMSCQLQDGDEIHIMGTTLLFYAGRLVIPSPVQTRLTKELALDMAEPIETTVDAGDYYVRTPRIIKTEEHGQVTIDPPPMPQKSKDIPFILTAGPSMTMSLAMLASLGVTISNVANGGSTGSLITGSVMAASMLAGALLWPSLLRRYNKKQEAENEQHRRERYTTYLADKEIEIRQKYERSIRVLNENTLPAPSALLTTISTQDRRLWERTPKDEDFLSVRLGTGERDFLVEIQSPRKGFTLEDDPMLDNAIALRDRYAVLHDVPIAISLAEKRIVGVVGSILDVVKVFVTNLIATHASDEVKLVFVYNAADIRKLQWLNDLPHVWSDDGRQRYIATNRNEVRTLFANLEEIISEREERLQSADARLPHFVVFVLDERLTEDVSFTRYMLNSENHVGVSAVYFGRRFSNIPKECTAIIQRSEDVSGIYIKNENDNRFIQYKPDEVSDAQMLQAARDINRVRIKQESIQTSVPDRVTFLDMYKVGNVDALEIMNHWKTNISEKSLAAPIGVKSDGDVFELDIHEKYHGCHGLVAGTTGSGKSEFLQAYILSMMVNFSPNEVAFVLVDFKGGDMARPFLKSPHLAATISNLSGNTLHRALLSLEAEVKNRQNTFNRAAETLGVDKIDINSYQKFFKDKKLQQPLPHLVIVIDEFAQLKTQHPEFMSKLVDIAQVGRSLGIHLILATQRPSGVVDPQIWSNSKFKVCLKVLDKQDSMDMINHPEAALIKQPGRAYVQVGYDEIFEQVQSGYSGADYIEQTDYIDEDSISLSMVNWPAEKLRVAKRALQEKRSNKTQLEEVVAEMAALGETANMRARQLWLPPLSAKLLLEKCAAIHTIFDPARWEQTALEPIVCGMMDLPEKQDQRPFGIDLVKNGHVAIYGSSGSGKSTLIHTLLFAMSLKYAPEDFHVFVMDFDGSSMAGVAAMPHCAMYAGDGDEGAVEDLLGVLQSLIDERHNLFAESHCANYESYVSDPTHRLPMVVVVLDNYAAFREKMYRCEDQLVRVISAARSCGIYFVITGNSKGAIYYKVTEQISNKVVLNMNDSGAYRDILNVAVPIVPETAKGRGLVLQDKKAVEVQFAVPFDTDNESLRMRRIHLVYEEMRNQSEGVSYHDRVEERVAAFGSVADTGVSGAHLPQVAAAVPVEDMDPSEDALIFGYDIKSGRAKGFSGAGSTKVFVGLNGNGAMTARFIRQITASYTGLLYLVTANDRMPAFEGVEIVSDVDQFVEDLVDQNDPNITVLIDGFCDFYDRISDEALSVLEKALTGSLQSNFITFDPMTRINDYRDTGLYVRLVRTVCGVIVGGCINDALASSLNTCLYDISHKYRERELTDHQAAIYCDNRISYINIQEDQV